MKTLKVLFTAILISLTFTSCQKEDIQPTNTNTTNYSSDCQLESSVQCTGTTQSGNQCQNMTLSCSYRCHYHD